MLLGEMIALCIIFVVLPPVLWRIIYIIYKNKYDKFMESNDALNNLKTILNSTLNSMASSGVLTPELIKKIKIKKSKILDKLDALIELIISRTGASIVYEYINDTYMQEEIKIKLLSEESIRGQKTITEDFMFLKRIIYELIKENKFPISEDFDSINKIYKKFKKMPKIKK